MTAPDAQPPVAPEVWWTQHQGQPAVLVRDDDTRPLLLFINNLFQVPADAVRLVAEPVTAALAGTTTPAHPSADWSSSWAELTGYVWQAAEDGTQIDPVELTSYLAELKRRALAPVADWMAALLASTPTRTEETEP